MVEEFTRAVEDYLVTILQISREKNTVRNKDIARSLKIAAPSVSEMLDRIKSLGLIEHNKYGHVKLTEKGLHIAKIVEERRKVFINFLNLLQVPSKIAEKDAHVLEHSLHDVTVKNLIKFLNFINDHVESSDLIEKWFKYLAK
ncbi:MAG: metal-dependent transcriptional regulator [Nitrososphaeria archaeon]|nr:metal-dependent transcriptional regulator [Nitrososphaeria archaeon]